MIDWADPKRTDVIRFIMVDPNNLDETYGEIEDVQLGSSSITYGYYTDTRYSSAITFLADNNYIKNSWIRIIHEVPKEGYTAELGTFIPTSPVHEWSGAEVIKLSLQSPLWGLTDDLTPAKFSIGKKTSYLDAFKRICETCNRPYVLQNPNDYQSTKAAVYDAGESYLSILFDIAGATDNRMELDGHGRILLSPNVDRLNLTPIWDLDADDKRSLIVEGTIKMDSEVDELPSRAIVIKEGIVGVADLADGVEYSAAQRGYTKAEKYSNSAATTAAKAKVLAQQYLDSASKITHYTMDTMYFPAKCGDNMYFTLNGEKHICMVQSIDPVDLETMTMTLTLREVG